MSWIDTHCHLDAAEFDIDRPAVLARAQAAGVAMQVLPAVAVLHFEAVHKLAHAHGLAYALGIHPLYTPQADEADIERLDQALCRHRGDPRLVAVGEIGLDGFVPGLDWARQQWFYTAQLRLARRHGLPVILHVRKSADGLLAGLRRHEVPGGIVHAFNASRQQADGFVARGFALGFGGAMTFERALQIRRLAADLPDTAVVLETDAPDIPPHWLYRRAAERGQAAEGAGVVRASSRNEPSELPRIAETLAQLRGWTLAQTAAQTSANACAALPRLAALGLPAAQPGPPVAPAHLRPCSASGVSGTG